LAYTSQRIGLVRITADSISHKLHPMVEQYAQMFAHVIAMQ